VANSNIARVEQPTARRSDNGLKGSTMPPRRLSVSFEVEWSSEAWAELRTLPASERGPVMEAARELAAGGRNPHQERGGMIAEERIDGGHRLLYRIVDPWPSPSSRRGRLRRRVQILGAIVETATGAVVARPGADELRGRGATLDKIGGGIPHEVVRRAWLAEMRREDV